MEVDFAIIARKLGTLCSEARNNEYAGTVFFGIFVNLINDFKRKKVIKKIAKDTMNCLRFHGLIICRDEFGYYYYWPDNRLKQEGSKRNAPNVEYVNIDKACEVIKQIGIIFHDFSRCYSHYNPLAYESPNEEYLVADLVGNWFLDFLKKSKYKELTNTFELEFRLKDEISKEDKPLNDCDFPF